MEELSFDNILGTDEIENLFSDNSDVQETPPPETKEEKETSNREEATEVTAEDLFVEPESVGSGKDNIEEKEDTYSSKDNTSPKYFYSSIANALKEEGIFPDLEDDVINKIKEPEDFRDLIEQQIRAGLDEKQRRIDEALNLGVEPTEIKNFESTISYLDSIKETDLKAEDEKGENLRKQLIYQDFINRGYSKERATREVQKSLNAGTDIEDAKEALNSNKEYFQEQYNNLVNEAREEEENFLKERKKQAENLKKAILEDKEVFGEIELDKNTRQRIYDNISKPVYKDAKTGELFTALQKYERDNRTDFLKNVGLLFTLTDGFKNLDSLVKTKVKKEVKKGLKELEHTINNTSRTSGGSLKFVSGVADDPESFIGKGWNIDV